MNRLKPDQPAVRQKLKVCLKKHGMATAPSRSNDEMREVFSQSILPYLCQDRQKLGPNPSVQDIATICQLHGHDSPTGSLSLSNAKADKAASEIIISECL
eukprot:TRINITY_DN5718_c0_g1_i11.p1 TRINITY_DN5718_c0_g1~~TRINITY_DN5718_c0_g1_i11.p1  ORF type:complete len:100 (-),score=18.62 TRINITY_DN5718_c0_g1_i11:146-445(-)